MIDPKDLNFAQPKYQELHKKRSEKLQETLAKLNSDLKSAQGDISRQKAIQHKIWLTTRMQGITGSVVGSIFNLSKWKSCFGLYNDYLGLSNDYQEMTGPQLWGHLLEPIIAQRYAEVTNSNVLETPTIQSSAYPFLLGSLDRVVVDKDGKALKVLEIKTATQNYNDSDFDEDGASLKAWGEGNIYCVDGSVIIDSQVPRIYYLQVMMYMIVTGLRQADIAVLISGNDFRIFTVEYDEYIANEIIKQADQFWCKNVLDEIPPSFLSEEDLRKLTPKALSSKEADDDTFELVKSLKKFTEDRKQAEELEKEARIKLLNYIGENEELTYKGSVLATFKQRAGSMRFDTTRFKTECPEQYQQYLAKGASSRTFILKKVKSE